MTISNRMTDSSNHRSTAGGRRGWRELSLATLLAIQVIGFALAVIGAPGQEHHEAEKRTADDDKGL